VVDLKTLCPAVSLSLIRWEWYNRKNNMAKQRYIQDSFWTDSYIESLSPDHKLVFLYLLTNPLCNIAGVYEITIKRIAYETGFDRDVTNNILKKFSEDQKITTWNDWIIINNHAKHQANNPAVEKGIYRIYGELPEDLQIIIRGNKLKKIPKIKNTLKSSKKERIKKRDNYECVICGSKNELQVDHIKPIFLGGNNEESNLRTLCKTCNLSRNTNDYNINYTGSDSLSEDDETSVKLSKVKLNKNKYGEFQNVLLTDEEYEKIKDKLDIVEELSGYIASTGKRYSSHYATILNWARRKTTQSKDLGTFINLDQ